MLPVPSNPSKWGPGQTLPDSKRAMAFVIGATGYVAPTRHLPLMVKVAAQTNSTLPFGFALKPNAIETALYHLSLYARRLVITHGMLNPARVFWPSDVRKVKVLVRLRGHDTTKINQSLADYPNN